MKRFLRTTAGKTVTFLLLMLMTALCGVCIVCATLFLDQGYYIKTQERALHEMTDYRLKMDIQEMVCSYDDDLKKGVTYPLDSAYPSMTENSTNVRYAVYSEDGWVLLTNTDPNRTDWAVSDNIRVWADTDAELFGDAVKYYRYNAVLEPDFPVDDDYRTEAVVLSLIYRARFPILPAGIVSLILAVVCFVILMTTSARKPDSDGIFPGPLNRIPFDLLAAGCVGLFFLILFPVWDACERNDVLAVACIAAASLSAAGILTGLSISAASRIKQGNLLSGTFVWFILKLLWKLLRLVGHGLKSAASGIGALFCSVPLIWKTILIVFAVSAVEFFVIGFNMYEGDNIMIFWLIEHLFLIPAILYAALCMRRLAAGAEELAKGNANAIVDTRRLILDFRRHGQNLNSVGQGLNRAVEQRMKSERMKTELITNVSHDIKTPLTSLISYADLIAKEPCENPAITEYAGVLTRQSERLKRLLDDLVEASKAATGSLQMNLEPTDLCVMLDQAEGEYRAKMEAAGLELVTSHDLRTAQPDLPVLISADGRRLWRVFDNLLGNALKYAQPGTRVYLSLRQTDLRAEITFRNVSKDPLNLSAEELMERFVRGDASRNAETGGSGLGLSIARSLTELQNGTFELTVDGDLFKVTLGFPRLGEMNR